MSKIKRISVSNIKAISKKSADFNGCTVIITGGNNKGKTTFLRSLIDRIRGIKPESVVKDGEKDGYYIMELTNGDQLSWSFKDGKEKLIFRTPTDQKGKSITKEISSFYFPKVFDIDKFLTDGPKDQKDALEKLSNVDLSEIGKLYKEAYENRTYANRKLVEENAKRELVDPEIGNEVKKFDESYIPIEHEINTAALHNEKIKNFSSRLELKKESLKKNQDEIELLNKKIKELEDSNMELENNIDIGVNYLKEEKNIPKTAAYVDDLKLKVSTIKEKNKLIEKNNKIIEQEKEYEKAKAEAERLDKEVEKLLADKIDAIKNSDMPEGFTFSSEGDGIEYNGFPFNKKSLSTSAIYIGALKLASIGLGDVKTLHFDASFLDKNSLMEIEQWANKQDLQLLIERPDFDGGEIEYQIIGENE